MDTVRLKIHVAGAAMSCLTIQPVAVSAENIPEGQLVVYLCE